MRQIQKDATNRSVDLYIIDSTDGTPETGVLWNTSGIDLKYRRDLEAAVSVTEATLAGLTTAHTDGGFLEIGNGVYRFDLPDAAWATGADHVTIFGTVTGMIVLPVTVQLVGYDPDSALATPTNITAATGVVLSGVTHTGAVIPTVTTLTGHTAQTGDSFARLGAPAGASVSADVAAVKSDTAAILVDTGTTLDARIPAALTAGGNMKVDVLALSGDTVAADNAEAFFDGTGYAGTNNVIPTVSAVTGLTASNLDATISSRATPAQVNTEVVDALNVDTYAEPGQGTPAATATLAAKINYLYKAWRNKKTQTSTTFSLFADDATTVDQKATVSDDATTATIGEIATGP